MAREPHNPPDDRRPQQGDIPPEQIVRDRRTSAPLPNYTLSTVCPACGSPTFKLACKVRCARCGFMWDCSEL